MSTVRIPIVDSLAYVFDRDTVQFEPVLESSPGTALVLTGKTVTATMRAAGPTFNNILNASYEDMAVTLGNTDHTAAQGGVTLSVSLNPTYITTPRQYGQWRDYIVQFYVSPDDSYSFYLLFHVLRAID